MHKRNFIRHIACGLPGVAALPLLAAGQGQAGRHQLRLARRGHRVDLAAELFKVRSWLNFVHVSYAAAAPQMTDLVSGQTQLAFDEVSSGMPFAKEGRIKLIVVAAKSRTKAFPQVPALGEMLPGYDAPAWLGIVAPKGTLQEVLDKLEAAFQEALADKEVRTILDGQGLDADPMNARAFGDKIRREMALWEEAVKASGMQPTTAK